MSLRFKLPRHVLVSLLRDSEYVGIQTAHVLAHVGLDCIGIIDRQVMVRVDGYEDDTAICVDRVLIDEANRQVVQDGWLVEI